MYKPAYNAEDWAARGARVVKAGALFSVLAVIAFASTHATMRDDLAAPAATTTQSAADTTPSYYFPSQYELNAPAEAAEQPATF